MSLLDIPGDLIQHHIAPYLTSCWDVSALRATTKFLSRAVPLSRITLRIASDDTKEHLMKILTQVSSIHESQLTPSKSKVLADALEKNTSIKSIDLHTSNVHDCVSVLEIIDKCENIEHLDLSNSRGLYAVDHAVSFAALASKRHLVSLNVEGAFEGRIHPSHLEILFRQSNFRRLTFARNSLHQDAFLAIADYISTSTSIQYLDISGLGITASGTETIAAALARNSSLKTLKFVGNYPGSDGLKAFAEAMARNSTLQKLDIRADYDSKAAPYIAQIIQRSCSLTSLRCGSDYIGSASLSVIAPAVAQSTSLRRLSIRHSNPNNIKGACDLAKALVSNGRITHLDFDCWSEFKHALQGLLPAFIETQPFRKLTLAQTHFLSDDELSRLLSALSLCQNLTDLTVSSSSLAALRCRRVIEFCNSRPSITRLSLRHNLIAESQLQTVTDALSLNSTLRELDLSRNCLVSGRSNLITHLLINMTSLQRLNLESNLFDAESVEMIARALDQNTTLLFLDLRMNLRRIDDGKVLIKEFAKNRTAQILI